MLDPSSVSIAKAIFVPSGDQSGANLFSAELVSCFRFVPSADITHRFSFPPRLETKTICAPSGGQAGSQFRLFFPLSKQDSLSPPRSIVQISVRLILSDLRYIFTNTTAFPSG